MLFFFGMRSEYSNYLNSQKDFRDKWNEYFALSPNFSIENFRPELTPLYGTPFYSKLTEEQRFRFFCEYIKLVAEALVFFEQLLMLGVWSFARSKKAKPSEAQKALKQFAFEELYHSHGFRHFLWNHKIFNWEKNKIFADARITRKIISKIVIWSPACVFLPGAKLEAFTLSYHKMIKKYYSNNFENAWIHLNYIHQVDEAHHLPLEFDLHDQYVKDAGMLRTWIGSVLFVLAMQVALFNGSYRVINYSFPQKSVWKKIILTLKMARWAVRTNPAYKEARVITRRQFQLKKPLMGKAMSFIYW